MPLPGYDELIELKHSKYCSVFPVDTAWAARQQACQTFHVGHVIDMLFL